MTTTNIHYLIQLLWIKDSGVTELSGLGPGFHKVVVKVSPELQSSEGLTEAGESTSEMEHFDGL